MNWDQLTTLEPQLLEFEKELQGMNALYEYSAFKKRVRILVGASRRPIGYERVPYPFTAKQLCTAAEMEEHEKKFNNFDRRIQMILALPEEQRVLHTEDAFYFVMQHLYRYHDGA